MSATAEEPKFPDAQVQLTGQDGNAYFVLGKVRQALRRAGATPEDLAAFTTEATSGTYDHLLVTAMRWADVL